MKTSVVPAQITTVEDRIAGNLNLVQIILLVIPLILSTIIYTVLPPFSRIDIYKLLLIVIVILATASMAIRIRDKILLDIVRLRLSYFFRPHIYTLQKQPTATKDELKLNLYRPYKNMPRKPTAYFINNSENITKLSEKDCSVVFKARTGGLYVEIVDNK